MAQRCALGMEDPVLESESAFVWKVNSKVTVCEGRGVHVCPVCLTCFFCSKHASIRKQIDLIQMTEARHLMM